MKRRCIKFNELSRGNKIFRIINLVLMGVMFFGTLALGIYYAVVGDPNNRVFSCFVILIPIALLFLIELVFKYRFSNFVFLIYELYVLLGGIGTVLNVYKLLPGYDNVIHVLAGYVFALFSLFFLSRICNYKKLNVWTVALFAFMFTLTIEYFWELIERFSDMFLGQTAQGDIIPGYDAPLVVDSMTDMFCNLCGGVVFVIHFLIGKLSKCSLGMNYIEKEFVFIRKDLATEDKLMLSSVEDDVIDKVEKQQETREMINNDEKIEKK